MTPMLFLIKYFTRSFILVVTATLPTTPAFAVDLSCSGLQMGELFINTETGMVTKSAVETLKVDITTESSIYRFEFKGKKNQFKAIINRTNGQIILDEACTPECWGGPIFGNCTPVKVKF